MSLSSYIYIFQPLASYRRYFSLYSGGLGIVLLLTPIPKQKIEEIFYSSTNLSSLFSYWLREYN